MTWNGDKLVSDTLVSVVAAVLGRINESIDPDRNGCLWLLEFLVFEPLPPINSECDFGRQA